MSFSNVIKSLVLAWSHTKQRGGGGGGELAQPSALMGFQGFE